MQQRPFIILMRFAAAAYGLLLSYLLVAPDPLFFLGREAKQGVPRMGVHFTAFLILAFLVGAARLRVGRWTLCGSVCAYALLIELAQFFSPPRTVELIDLAENYTGLIVGMLLWMAVAKLWERWSTRLET